ncbi:hypothetical protein FKW77_000143 [Venturia effusa]|uniref:Prokaryotic-type class I peptide chain release factors domain-containing protein n=1 Tax=Venturia effusa TaxID=50376 RepID=A0A517LQI1_9PEZI|nr:hypothetical protein FKW77_000143 [Venturia effusa]
MSHCLIRLISAPSTTARPRPSHFSVLSFSQFSTSIRRSTTSPQSDAPNEDDVQKCRLWLSQHDPKTFPRSIGTLSYSRSSGPGGQNVNKVSSKATLRVPANDLLKDLPILMHEPLRASRYYAKASNNLVIQADDSRKQADNAERCWERFHQLLKETAGKAVPGITSDYQKSKVKSL